MITKLNNIISNIPILVIGYWLCCIIFFTKCDFYIKNFDLFDLIDTYIVSFSILHFIFKFTHYNRSKRIFIICMIAIICLNFCYLSINKEAYYFLYFVCLFITILNSIWKKI